MKYTFSIFFWFFLITSKAGGGWTPKKGEGFSSLGFRTITGQNYINNFSNFGFIPQSSNSAIVTYVEYGLTDKWCGILYSPLISSSKQMSGIDFQGTILENDKAVGIGDVDLGIKRSLINGKYAVSATLILGIPSGDFTAGKTKQLRLGDGDFSQLLRFDVSRSFKKTWATIYSGYNNRTANFSSDVQFGGEFGWKKKGFIAILKAYGRISLDNGSKPISNYPGIYSNNIEYIGLGPQVMYFFKNNFGIYAEAGFAFYTRNIVGAPSLSIGIAYDIKKKAK